MGNESATSMGPGTWESVLAAGLLGALLCLSVGCRPDVLVKIEVFPDVPTLQLLEYDEVFITKRIDGVAENLCISITTPCKETCQCEAGCECGPELAFEDRGSSIRLDVGDNATDLQVQVELRAAGVPTILGFGSVTLPKRRVKVVLSPPPTVFSMVPSWGDRNIEHTDVIITGENFLGFDTDGFDWGDSPFDGEMVVRIDGEPVPVVAESRTRLRITVPACPTCLGEEGVQVLNPNEAFVHLYSGWYYADEDVSWGAPFETALPALGGVITAAAFGDLDGGSDDVVLVAAGLMGADDTVVVARNNGTGTFTADPPFTVPHGSAGPILSVAIGDLGGASPDLDLALGKSCTGTCADGSLALYLDDGMGGFQDALATTPDLDVELRSIALVDVDGDGDDDVVGASGTTRFVIAMISDDGSAIDSVGVFDMPGGANLGDATPIAGFFDSTNGLDVVFPLATGGSLGFLTNGALSSVAPDMVLLAGPGSTSDMVADDVNRDGDQDLVLGSVMVSAGFAVALGDDAGLMNMTPTPYSSLPGLPSARVATGDFNGDGWPDVAVCGGGSIEFFMNDEGTYITPAWTAATLPGTGVCVAMQGDDVDGDGDDDVIVVLIANMQAVIAVYQTLIDGK